MRSLREVQLGPWTLEDLCRTNHRSLDNTPLPDDVMRLKVIAEIIGWPLTRKWGKFWCSSGYRSEAVNRACGGAKQSAHLYGCALDLIPMDAVNIDDVMVWLAKTDLPIDQAIDEHSTTDNWLHIGMIRPGFESVPRRQFLQKFPGLSFSPFPLPVETPEDVWPPADKSLP